MTGDQLRAYRDELERMREAGDHRQRVIDTYEYVIGVFERRRISQKGRPKTLISASSVYLLKSDELRSMIRALEARNPMSEEQHNTLALLRGEQARRERTNKKTYQRRKAEVAEIREALCSTP